MSPYLVIESAWLETQIDRAKTLCEHAEANGRPIAIAAARVRLESLKEIRKVAAVADAFTSPPGSGPAGD